MPWATIMATVTTSPEVLVRRAQTLGLGQRFLSPINRGQHRRRRPGRPPRRIGAELGSSVLLGDRGERREPGQGPDRRARCRQ